MVSLATPFSTVLDTNYSPSSGELGEIRSFLGYLEPKIRVLDEQISKLQAERDELQTFVNRHRRLLSPVRRLSPEILGTIFVHSLPTNTFNLSGRTVADAPLLLTMICRSWREIALSTPRLWIGIHVHLPRFVSGYLSNDEYLSNMMRRKEGIKRWLERSGSLPLNISISTGSSSRLPSIDGQTQDIAILADVLRVFSMHSHRWRSVIFTGDPQAKSPAIWAPFAELKKDELPQLQDFRTFSSLMSFDSRWQIVPTTLASLVTRSTSLTTLHVTNEQSISTILELQVSWTSIKELHLTSSESERWDPALITRKVAKLCPSLVSFKLKLWTSWISGSTTTSHPLLPSLHWPRLRSFDLTIVDCQRDHLNKKLSGAFWRALQGMTAPALTHLSLKAEVARASCYPRHELSSAVGVPAVEPVSRLPFQDMISESGCTISHLSLSGIFLMDEGALIHALELVPSLTSLTLTDCANRIFIVPLGHNPTIPHHKLAACLNSLSSSADLCPDIAEMSISACQIDNIEPIVSFAKARSTKLKRLSVDFGAITKEGGDKVAQITSSTDISDSLHHLRENRGIKVDWKWTASKFSLNETYNMHSRPYTGMEIQN